MKVPPPFNASIDYRSMGCQHLHHICTWHLPSSCQTEPPRTALNQYTACHPASGDNGLQGLASSRFRISTSNATQ